MAALSTFTEDYSAALDSEKWDIFNAVATGGVLELTPPNTAATETYAWTDGWVGHSLDSVYFQVVRPPQSTGGPVFQYLRVRNTSDDGTYIDWLIDSSNGHLIARYQTSFTPDGNDVDLGVWDEVDHKWLKIELSGGTLTWQTAPDAGGTPGTWTVQRTKTSVTGFTDVVPAFFAIKTDTATLTQSVQIDGLNTTGTSESVSHATSGALTGSGASLAGTAARTRQHAATGDLQAAGAILDATATHQGPHAASGDLVGPGAALSGVAARTRQHAASGDLTGPGASVTGAAALNKTHATDGVLQGAGAAVEAAAARTLVHDTSGDLAGPGAAVEGAASRTRLHETDGVLAGQTATLAATALRENTSKTDSIRDAFDGAALDTGMWTASVPQGTGSSVLAGGALVQTVTSGETGDRVEVISVNAKDLTDSHVFARLSQPIQTAGSGDGAEAVLEVEASAGNSLSWHQQSVGTLEAQRTEGGVVQDNVIRSYTPSTDAWLRIREKDGTVYWQTAPASSDDPPLEGQWVTRYSLPVSSLAFALTAVKVRFTAGVWWNQGGIPTQPAKWDCVNTQTRAALSHDTSGDLAAAGASLAGAASIRVQHATSGALAGSGASLSAAAGHGPEHRCSGALVGSSAIISANGSTSDATRKLWIDAQDMAGAWSDKPQSADPWTPVPESGSSWGS